MKKVGDVFKIRNVEYTVIAVFGDNGDQFFVAKHPTNYGWSYGNVFAYDEDGKIYKRS